MGFWPTTVAGPPHTIHAAVVHINPFWDGDGRIARLIANLPLLQSGLPPVVIPKARRREYIQLLELWPRGQ